MGQVDMELGLTIGANWHWVRCDRAIWNPVLPSGRIGTGRDGTGRHGTRCSHRGELAQGDMGQGDMVANWHRGDGTGRYGTPSYDPRELAEGDTGQGGMAPAVTIMANWHRARCHRATWHSVLPSGRTGTERDGTR